MAMASDISGLQKACGSELAAYQEIVRDEKSANCRARWPLLAQTAFGDSAGLPIAAEAVPAQHPSQGGGGVAVRVAARFDGIVRPQAAALGAAPGYSPAAVQAAASAIAAAAAAAERAAPLPLPTPLPRLVAVVERGALLSPARDLPRAKAMTPPPLRKPARAVAPAPRAAGVVAGAASAASVAGSPRTGLSDLFKRLDAPQARSGGPQR